jgi:hypothetical protein
VDGTQADRRTAPPSVGVLAVVIGASALDRDADQRAPVSHHRPAIIVPIRMFTGQAALIIHERFHGFW